MSVVRSQIRKHIQPSRKDWGVFFGPWGRPEWPDTKAVDFPATEDIFPEKAMAPHSSTLAWKIPWMEEPGRLQSMGSLRVGYD